MLRSRRVAVGPRALPTCSTRRACAQRTPVRMCMSLRSVEVIAELYELLPPERAPVLKKLTKAVKEDLEEAEQQRQQAEQQRQQAEQRKDEAMAMMIREKDEKTAMMEQGHAEKMALVEKLSLRDKMLSRTMYSAGVRDGRSCMEHLEGLHGIVKTDRVRGWTRVLQQQPDLIDCLTKAVPSWGVDAKHSNAAGRLAGKIAGMFNVLSGGIHTFVPELGLIVYTGVPDGPTCEGLVCLAEAFGVPCERHEHISPS